MLFTNYIFLDTFVLILLQQFEEFQKNPMNPVIIFKENVEHFQCVYSQYLSKYQVKRIHMNKIVNFFRYLNKPLGFFLELY